MIRTAAEIKLTDNAEWGMPFATTATAKNGRLSVVRTLTESPVFDWREAQQHFQVYPHPSGAYVRYNSKLLGVGPLAVRTLRSFFNPEYHHASINTNNYADDRVVSMHFPLFTSAILVGEEVAMQNYRHISMTELAGSALYATFSTLEQYGADNILSIQCHDDRPISLVPTHVPKIN